MNANRPWIKLIISLGLIFHLFGILVAPNPGSYLSQSVSFIYRPYLNTLGLAHTWGFFAPEPVSPPMYIDYVLERKDNTPLSGRFPDQVSPFFFRDRQNRRMSMSKFILSTDDNIRNMFVRYLCLHEKDVSALNLWRVVSTQPSLQMVQEGKVRMTDPVEQKIEVLGTYYCPEKL